MNTRNTLITLVISICLLITACGTPASTPTAAPIPTAQPAPTSTQTQCNQVPYATAGYRYIFLSANGDSFIPGKIDGKPIEIFSGWNLSVIRSDPQKNLLEVEYMGYTVTLDPKNVYICTP